MVFAKSLKKYFPLKVEDWLLILYLCAFPLAQLTRIELSLSVGYVAIYPTDLFIFAFISATLTKSKLKRLALDNLDLIGFFSVTVFSFLISFFTYNFPLFPGAAYLIRLVIYLSFFMLLPNYLDSKSKLKGVININTLLILSVVIGVLGYLQYLFLPDLRSLYYIGWDDHLNRLVGTFLDPGFISVFFVFGCLLAFKSFLDIKKYGYLFLSVGFIFLLGLTYARAGFLALVVSFAYLLLKSKKYVLLVGGLILFTLFVIGLPNKAGEGTNLKRLYSVELRIKNYKETFEIFKENPLFGVGYSNLCSYRVQKLSFGDSDSHACSGSDNGILLVLATTGVVGFISFASFVIRTIKRVSGYKEGEYFFICLIALFVHMQFVNSIFNPWVLGFLALIYANTLKGRVSDK